MAKGVYVGVGGVAKKVNKMYVGVGGVARKVKKIFAGVGGAPKLVYSAGVSKVSEITPLAVARLGVGATATSSHAIFSGGSNGGSYGTAYNDAYNASLVRSSPNNGHLYEHSAGVPTSNYAFLFGGYRVDYSKDVYVFDTSIVKTSLTNMYRARRKAYGIEHARYALVAGGGVNDIEIYDTTTLAHFGNTYMSNGGTVEDARFAAVGNYALLAGGIDDSGHSTEYVRGLDKSLGFPSVAPLANPRKDLAGANVGNHALFAGGYVQGIGNVATVEAYNTSLIKSNITPLGVARRYSTGLSLEGYAIFAGGYINVSPYNTNFVDIYDANLVRTTGESLNANNRTPLSVVFRNYGLILQNYSSYSSTIEGYEI